MQATTRTLAGKRELARRTRALRLEWKVAVEAADRIARGKTPLPAAAGKTYYPKVVVEQSATARQQHHTSALLEVPFVRFLWGVHGSTTPTAADAVAAAGEDDSDVRVEPSELKYLGASVRQTLFGRATRRVRDGAVRNQTSASFLRVGVGEREEREGY